MTNSEALQEARSRWGEMATVTEVDIRTYQDENKRFWVSSSVFPTLAVVGRGSSWEAAFADADRRAAA
jgi:hypothetical protein